MRVIKLVADRQRERRASPHERPEPLAGRGPLARREGLGAAPLLGDVVRSALGVAVVLFYVILTPVWIGLRALAWVAEFRARRRTLRNASTSAWVRSRTTRIAARAPPGSGAGGEKCDPQRVRDQRVAAPDDAAEGLAVAVPDLLVAAQAPRGAPQEPRQPDAQRQVDPDDERPPAPSTRSPILPR